MSILIVAVLIGLLPAAVAQSKGRNFVAWWIYGAALFIIALPHALMLGANTKKCPHCAEFVKPEATVCKHCHSSLQTK